MTIAENGQRTAPLCRTSVSFDASPLPSCILADFDTPATKFERHRVRDEHTLAGAVGLVHRSLGRARPLVTV